MKTSCSSFAMFAAIWREKREKERERERERRIIRGKRRWRKKRKRNERVVETNGINLFFGILAM